MASYVSNIQFVVQPVPRERKQSLDEEERFQEKLLQLSENVFSSNIHELPAVLQALQYHAIRDCAIGPENLAFLLEDGRVCRLSYTTTEKPLASQKVTEDAHGKEKNHQSKTGARKSIKTSDDSSWNINNPDFLGMGSAVSWTRWGNRIGVIRSTASTGSSAAAAAAAAAASSSARKTARQSSGSASGLSGMNIRLIRSGQARARNNPLLTTGSQRMPVPLSHVPEDLINQVQGVLQGKSRNVIIRELQRTSLDVNLAVNNLLSRDDEDNDDLDDGSDYIPGEELMSLLDGGIHTEEHPRVVIDADTMLPEDLLGYSFTSRGIPSARGLGGSSGGRASEHDGVSSPPWIDLFRRVDSKRQSKSSTVVNSNSGITLGKELQWWNDELGTPVKFTHIGAMFSELVAIDNDGVLRQWNWKSSLPHHESEVYHPRASSLNLTSEKITFLATSPIRASVVTQDGSIATWMDDSIANHARSLDQPRFVSEPIKNEQVKSLHVCSLYSAVLTQQGRIYWWGILPFHQRKKILEKSKNTLVQNIDKEEGSTGKQQICIGNQICLKRFPIYHAGAIAVNLSGGAPKIGCLLESVWSLDKKSSFKLLTEQADVASAAPERSADVDQAQDRRMSQVLDESSKSRKRKRSADDDDSEEKQKEEVWDLKEVIFIEDVRSVPVGRVVMVDENIVAVSFSNDDITKSSSDSKSLLDSCRLLHKNDVIVVKSSLPKILDCVQKTPRRVQCEARLSFHCIAATATGISAVVSKSKGKLSYAQLSLSMGKVTNRKQLPTKTEAFHGTEQGKEMSASLSKCKLLNCGQECPTLLQDYNAMLYPLLADENDGIRDAVWADIPPLHAWGMGLHADTDGGRSTVTVLAFHHQLLMPLVLRRDLKAFEKLLTGVESKTSPWFDVFSESLTSEMCDGRRNLLHMCIEMSIPSSNKEQKEDEKEAAAARKQPETSSTKLPAGSSGRGMYMPEALHAEAVNAIASAISAVTRGPIEVPTTSSLPPARPPPPDMVGSSLPPPPGHYSPSPSRSSIPMSGPHPLLGSVVNPEVSPPESPISTWPPEIPTWRSASIDKADEEGMNLSTSAKKTSSNAESKGRGSRLDAVAILKLLCTSQVVQPHLKKLLTQKDTSGYTPFMFAVAHRAYPAALVLFSAAVSLSKDATPVEDENATDAERVCSVEQTELVSMIYPTGSNPDDNPLYMLCCNDTCSFTWTGAQHINQDIFECLTCGLTETLCCCTECAKVCHKGHDCKLKRTSPTAYCDCWEKCACKSLVAGDSQDRMALLRSLLHLTNLYERSDSNGQHILHFLVQTIARQVEEQRQWHPPRTARMTVSSSRSRLSKAQAKSTIDGTEQDMPEHDLHPPRFCREALLQLLSDWKAVRSLVLGGKKGRRDRSSMSSRLDAKSGSFVALLPEDEELLERQSGTARLDMFTHTLLAKCSSCENLDKLLETLIHAAQSSQGDRREEGIVVARRFLRSVIRVFVVLTAQSSPEKLTIKSSFYSQPTTKCRRAFVALIPFAIEELCETAEALIAPVRMGVSLPTTSFSLLSTNQDILQRSAWTFSKLPFPPRSTTSDDDDNKNESANRKNRKRRKTKKHSKRPPSANSSRRYGSGRVRGQSQSAEGDERQDSVQPETSQETNNEEAEASDKNDDDRESDMDLTDIEILAESDSDSSVASHESEQILPNDEASQDASHYSNDDDEYDIDLQLDDQVKNEDDDTDSDHNVWLDEHNLERQATRQQRAEARQAPHTMQWAMGLTSMVPVKPPRTPAGRNPEGTTRVSSNSGIIYLEQRSSRRHENLENAYINNLLDRHYAAGRIKTTDTPRIKSPSATNAQLSRLFAACVREVSHLLAILRKGDYLSEAPLSTVLEVSFKECGQLQRYVETFLHKTWNWLLLVVESTEYKLRYGQVLSIASSPTHKDHPHHKTPATGENSRPRDLTRPGASTSLSEDSAARQDLLAYVLSLMRSHNNEHSDMLPVVDVSSLKHVAYVLDAYIYYLRGLSYRDSTESRNDNMRAPISLGLGYDNSENDDDDDDFSYHDDEVYPVQADVGTNDDDLSSISHPTSSFFRRSESMTFLGCDDPSPFQVPLPSALPLADKPHLLQPTSRKEELFGRPRMQQTYKYQLTSMSLTRRSSDSAARDKTNDDSVKNPPAVNLPPPPAFSSVIRSTSSSQNPPTEGEAPRSNVSGTASTEDVPMEAPPAPGATVTVDSEGTVKEERETSVQQQLQNHNKTSVESVLGRCWLTLELFSQVFLDDVGSEPRSILQELGGFEVCEAKFRKDMEKLRTAQTLDLQLNVERSRDALIQQTFKQLNKHYKRKSGSRQPLAVLRVKVLFKDEPGEGTGVARSFYTAICEALLNYEQLPNLTGVLPDSDKKSSVQSLVAHMYKQSGETSSFSSSSGSNVNLRSFLTDRFRNRGSRRGFSPGASVTPMSTSLAPYYSKSSREGGQSSLERSKQAIGERLFPKVALLHAAWAPKITGMLLGLPAYELLLLLRSERALQDRVFEAVDQLMNSAYSGEEPADGANTSGESRPEASEKSDDAKTKSDKDEPDPEPIDDAAGGPPLFYQPGKRGVYALTSWGEQSEVRMNAYRNVGRIIGLCLLQNELCPLPLSRHVLKFILGRKINWHDLAFFDPTLYESLRQLLLDAEIEGGAFLRDLELNFVVDLQNEESGRQVPLIPEGATTPVTLENIHDYVRRYALQRMVVCCKKPLEKLRQGVCDVLPRETLQSLTAENLRLLVNGCGHVDVHTLISYTQFNDESGKSGSADKLLEFKRWFWAVVDRMSPSEKQELLYFWTGSPALPASEDGFQPMPTITIRPQDDQHLPTANTCISRLYVPLYSSRQILRQKLSMAIKTKNFGFV